MYMYEPQVFIVEAYILYYEADLYADNILTMWRFIVGLILKKGIIILHLQLHC